MLNGRKSTRRTINRRKRRSIGPKKWKGDPEVTISVFGLDNSGKTSLISSLSRWSDSNRLSSAIRSFFSLCLPCASISNRAAARVGPFRELRDEDIDRPKAAQSDERKYSPTIGFSFARIKIGRCTVRLFDVGGGEKIRGLWENYFAETHGVIYTIDSTSSHSRLQESKDQLYKLYRDHRVFGKPLLILFTKMDLPIPTNEGRMSISELTNFLNLDRLTSDLVVPTSTPSDISFLGCKKECANKKSIDSKSCVAEAREELKTTHIGEPTPPNEVTSSIDHSLTARKDSQSNDEKLYAATDIDAILKLSSAVPANSLRNLLPPITPVSPFHVYREDDRIPVTENNRVRSLDVETIVKNGNLGVDDDEVYHAIQQNSLNLDEDKDQGNAEVVFKMDKSVIIVYSGVCVNDDRRCRFENSKLGDERTAPNKSKRALDTGSHQGILHLLSLISQQSLNAKIATPANSLPKIIHTNDMCLKQRVQDDLKIQKRGYDLEQEERNKRVANLKPGL
ncbi:hypothetical protein BKA69DRAFT_1101127 [Paraphysoderma sedebokerense]|nr:hypothetical protein BKA69DRAFT_1101127 [Paraphysoderma sedebokerense]